MRLKQITSLVMGWLLLSAACAHAQGRSRHARPAPAPNQVVATFEAIGYGENWDYAYDCALKDAQAKIASWATAEDPSLQWKPSLALVQRLVKKLERSEDDVNVEKVGLMRQVSLEVEVTQNDVNNIQREAREFRSTDRMILLSKILAGLVAFFAAIAAYFRLEDATKGYYTNWLRLGALGFVAAVGVALFLVS
jgi:hypothetical protein